MRRILSPILVLVVAAMLLTAGVPSASAAAGEAVLSAGQRLNPGQSLISPNGYYRLVLQGDGNLVLYGPGGGPTGALWATNTSDGAHLDMQSDGNLVLYKANNVTAAWASWTQNNPGSWVQLQDDGNLVVYRPGAVGIYASGVANPYSDLVVDHNIAGNHQPSGSTAEHLKMIYQRLGLAGLPWAITAQEVCGNQAYNLAAFLAWAYPGQYWVKYQNNYTYTINGVVTAGNPSTTCTGGYGNLVAVRATGFTPQLPEASYSGSGRYSAFLNGQGVGVLVEERKGYVCVEGGVGAPSYFGCNTHFWPGSVNGVTLWTMADKKAALTTYRDAINYLFAYRQRVITGNDMYMSRDEIIANVSGVLGPWSDSMSAGPWVDGSGTLGQNYTYQADHILTRGTGAGGKSGYVLLKPYCPATGNNAETCHGSDHRLLFSRGTM
jgi:hypothetical protein